jgi:2-phosphoglycerate kinase
MLREVMRLMIPRRLIPTLHTSSFLAYRALSRFRTGSEKLNESAMIEGYLNQSDQVGVGIEGVLSRAMNERVSLIIEGVHLHPALQKEIQERTDALVVPITIAVLGKKYLKKQLTGRGQQISSRRSERYLENFDRIWELQSFLLSEADRNDIPIVSNEDEEETIHVIMQIVSEHLERWLRQHPEAAADVDV